MENQADGASKTDAYTSAKPSRFHFKSSSHRKRRHDRVHSYGSSKERPSGRHRSEEEDDERRSLHNSRRKHKHRHREDRHPTSTLDGEYYDPDHRYRESLFDNVDYSAADHDVFRESLFDALADDEGAAYWEGVYGQPINIYPMEKPGPDGELERMTEDEYADFVRTKMWEKSHQHILEEREARERARQERKKQHARRSEEARREDTERERIRQQMEESLRRGEERKKAKEFTAAWETYNNKWEFINSTLTTTETGHSGVAALIPWPVLSGKAKHVDQNEIECFLRTSPAWREDSSSLLKAERVRWHPDKMQRRFGQYIDSETMRTVTAVFQVIDHMWNAHRNTRTEK